MIIVGQSPNIRSIAENRRRSTEAYRRVMSTWPSMMVGTAEGNLPKLFSQALNSIEFPEMNYKHFREKKTHVSHIFIIVDYGRNIAYNNI